MTCANCVRLGTRASALARWQAEWVSRQLRPRGIAVELVPITTQGDVQTGPIGAIRSQGVFTKEIQRALLDGQIDLAVHSMKDLPTECIPGLAIAAVPPRGPAGDVLVSHRAVPFDALSPGARVGTGSMRRRAQLLHVRPDLHVLDIRGNVDTRLRHLEEGRYDAIVLAEAGLTRLGLAHRITQVLPIEWMLPAIGQGALALEIRADDGRTRDLVAPLDDLDAHAAITAERALLAALHGGCLAPVGAWGRVQAGTLALRAAVLDPQGTQRVAAEAAGSPHDAQCVGLQAAQRLLEQGAATLIAQSRD